jgi:hypothetical protein
MVCGSSFSGSFIIMVDDTSYTGFENLLKRNAMVSARIIEITKKYQYLKNFRNIAL